MRVGLLAELSAMHVVWVKLHKAVELATLIDDALTRFRLSSSSRKVRGDAVALPMRPGRLTELPVMHAVSVMLHDAVGVAVLGHTDLGSAARLNAPARGRESGVARRAVAVICVQGIAQQLGDAALIQPDAKPPSLMSGRSLTLETRPDRPSFGQGPHWQLSIGPGLRLAPRVRPGVRVRVRVRVRFSVTVKARADAVALGLVSDFASTASPARAPGLPLGSTFRGAALPQGHQVRTLGVAD
eukprot:CAMPEP_0118881942 /NCGR_PEP_ID=MMETSP1163-20130328/21303_1 /TAXON_ID=124430 /ORGANISM="Phaeomonas parva, Strain CCMP2877" /LENGTH=241 /DNA_ID=CAMNT_0006818865 /DNA_START=540 /DNA_END=1269 /DNA_ORIENTATION=-